jgi:DNA-binding response OmpR family regulator
MPKVLVIDDDEDLLEMVTLMLESNGIEATGLNTGQLLFNALALQSPDVLIMDIYLGDSDGRDLCKLLKDSPTYADLPIFLYSARDISHSSIVASKADLFFRKPFVMKQLVERIRDQMT